MPSARSILTLRKPTTRGVGSSMVGSSGVSETVEPLGSSNGGGPSSGMDTPIGDVGSKVTGECPGTVTFRFPLPDDDRSIGSDWPGISILTLLPSSKVKPLPTGKEIVIPAPYKGIDGCPLPGNAIELPEGISIVVVLGNVIVRSKRSGIIIVLRRKTLELTIRKREFEYQERSPVIQRYLP